MQSILSSMRLSCLILFVFLSAPIIAADAPPRCDVEFVVLGIGQDGGAPQIDNQEDPGWQWANKRLYATAGALVDNRSGDRFLFEATPDIREQLYALNSAFGENDNDTPLGLSGVFLTHAHIGHYAGLMFAGHESAGTKGLRVFAMPRMREFLESNGPWDQLVRFQNIDITTLADREALPLKKDISVTPYQVPHRDEYSETVGFVINGLTKRVLFLPDIDDWGRWENEFGTRIEDMVADVDFAYVDATFFDNNELPGRDMSSIPHPRITESMQRLKDLTTPDKSKVRFIHLNHTNKARFENSDERQHIAANGFRVAQRNERVCLD